MSIALKYWILFSSESCFLCYTLYT